MNFTGTDLITVILLAGIFIAVVVYLLYWLYRRSSKDVAFVRTGFGGEKAVLSGGALVLPIIHTVTRVGMSTLRLEVRRIDDKSIITQNKMRVDVVAEFYVRVRPDVKSVLMAAQTLGSRTLDAERLRELIQGRFVDALSTVAAQMTMDGMQEHRGEYIKAVRELAQQSLGGNGLELEAASLTGLNQTPIEAFNPSNAFDAEGLTQLTEQIEKRKKIRNDIEQDTMVQIRAKNLEAEKQALEIDRESEYSRMLQEREIAQRRALEKAAIAKERALRDREAQEAEISSEEAIERARILRDKAIEVERLLRETEHTEEIENRRKHRNEIEREAELAVRSKDQEVELKILDIERDLEQARLEQQQQIATRRAQQLAEVARQKAAGERDAELAQIELREAVDISRIAQLRTVELEEIGKVRQIETGEVSRRKALQLAEIDRSIAVIEQEAKKTTAQVAVENARAQLAEAEEAVATRRESAATERRKLVELIDAARIAESEAIQLTTLAAAQTSAAEQKAAAEKFAVAAARMRYEVDAAGRQQINEADNVRSADTRYHDLRMKLIDRLDSIIRESVKPMEQIKDIKILQVDGLPGLSGANPSGGGNDLDGPHPRGGGSLADNLVSSALRYRAQVPFVDKLLKEIGMSPSEITQLGKLIDENGTPEKDNEQPGKGKRQQKATKDQS